MNLELQRLRHFVRTAPTLSRNKVLPHPGLSEGILTFCNAECIQNFICFRFLSWCGLDELVEFTLARPVHERLLLMCFQYTCTCRRAQHGGLV